MVAAPSYATKLPENPEELRERLRYVLEYWKRRNNFIRRGRAMTEGRNPVRAPKSTQYKIEVTHTFHTLASIEEKLSRFLARPEVAILPFSTSTTELDRASKQEHDINQGLYWMDVNADTDVWTNVCRDAISYDEGVEKIQFAPAAFWPEITRVVADEEGNLREALSMMRPFESQEAYDEFRDNYKLQAGFPLRTVHTPLETIYPILEGPTHVESFEVTTRSLREVMNNPLFRYQSSSGEMSMSAGVGRLTNIMGNMSDKEKLEQRLTVIEYSNLAVHAYYALLPSISTWTNGMNLPGVNDIEQNAGAGTPIYLYHYNHNLGRLTYNFTGGRFGGWKKQTNEIEAIMNGMMRINQDLDELMSQIKTNVRGTYWPTQKFMMDQDKRGGDSAPPRAPEVQEGQNIAMWVGEDIVPMFKPNESENPMAQWLYQTELTQFERLAGGGALFGERSPGVETGYHQEQQITQQQSLDEKLEQHLSQGVVGRTMLMLQHIYTSGEKVPVQHHRATPDKKKKLTRFGVIDPKSLDPMPQMSARVKRPRPVDYPSNIRAAIEASQDRAGPGTPLMPDTWIYEKILGEAAPDVIEEMVMMQNQRRQLLQEGIIAEMIAQRLGIKVVQNAGAGLTPEQMAETDPALLQQLQLMNQSGAPSQMGGVSFDQLAGQMEAAQSANVPIPINRQGQGGGPSTGQPQPEQNAARLQQRTIPR